ncbi:MAG: KH domain-containing protein [Candidatus Shapirobacteria bacterium]|nr:KH domain-containing protein [Candidatus Shapirobacteria bacterium]
MEKFIKFLLINIVDQPKAIAIDTQEGERGKVYLVDVAEEDRGKIIGKEGRVIQSLRSLVNIKAQKEGQRAFLELNF